MPISLQGQILLADPSLREGIFRKSVIFLTEHSLESGALGNILNHPSGKIVSDLVPNLAKTTLADLPVYCGGPLSMDQLSFSSLAWHEKSGLIYLPQISAEAAAAAVSIPGNQIQASVGHSAWSPGQLEHELQRNTWITRKPNNSLTSVPLDSNLWKTLLETISPYHSLLAGAPDDPSLN